MVRACISMCQTRKLVMLHIELISIRTKTCFVFMKYETLYNMVEK